MSEMSKNAHKSGHHHHKNEMEHHRMRDKAKSAHMSVHGHSSGDIDNPKVSKDNHQQGIARVKQRHGDMPVGQHGSMAGGWSNGKK